MADLYRAEGSRTIEPVTGLTDGVLMGDLPIDMRLLLKAKKFISPLTLTTDDPVVIALENLAMFHLLVVRVIGGGAKLSLVNTYGTQHIWCEPALEITAKNTAPFTGFTITRPPATQVVAHIFMGEKA